MKIAIIGANGRSGQACVEAVLKAGFKVRAGVYHRSTLGPQANLEIIQVDGTKREDIVRLLEDCEAVVSLIGHIKGSPEFIQTDTTKNILEEMRAHGITRLISLTGTGVRQPGDKPSFIDRLLNVSIATIDPARIKDGIRHAELIVQSETDWTIIRVLKLGNGKATTYSLSTTGPARLLTSRATVADVIVDILRHNSHIREAPIISTGRKTDL
jgi:uncharacterized protein YbjT (DUF2867 family)